jgi:hypothetical protein
MQHDTQGRVARQVRRTRQQLLQDQDLCFGRLLPAARVQEAIQRHKVHFRKRMYTPLVTLWAFLYQVLSTDQACRAAVARLLAFLGLHESGTVNPDDGPYCKARKRLPEALVADLARQTGHNLHQKIQSRILLKGRPLVLADGTTASMPDTPANQKEYPQQAAQKPGLGFPILRLVGLISLASGAVLDVAMAAYKGKRTGETTLLRQLLGSLKSGEILLGDAQFANYWTIALLLERGVDLLARADGRRTADFRTGQRLGPQDHIACWHKPQRPTWMGKDLYGRLPMTLAIREVRVQVKQRGFRVRSLLLATTLLEAECYRTQDLAEAYRRRWQVELDLRSIKVVMQMQVLRCKSPAMVRKEIWMHLLGYNLIRQVMAEAAAAAGIEPRQISFAGTLQTLTALAMAGWGCPPQRVASLYTIILKAVALHRVGDRPDRIEPRANKRRPRAQRYMTEPRAAARKRLLNAS